MEVDRESTKESNDLLPQLKHMLQEENQKLSNSIGDIAVRLSDVETAVKSVNVRNEDTKKSIALSDADNTGGVLRFKFNINDLQRKSDQALGSNRIRVAGAEWFIRADKTVKKGCNYLGLYLCYEKLLKSIYHNASYSISLLGTEGNITRNNKDVFNKDGWGWDNFMTWADFAEPTDGFLDADGNAVVEIEFKCCASSRNKSPFSSHVASDCVLLVEDQKIDVNKGFLSVYSPYFCSLFNEDIKMTDSGMIEIKDVSFVEFVMLLEAIHPSSYLFKITKGNVETLLRMAARFEVESVTMRCEAYLKSCPNGEIALEKKLLLAQDHGLIRLQNIFVKKYKTVAEIKTLKQTVEYGMFNNEIKVVLMESFLENL